LFWGTHTTKWVKLTIINFLERKKKMRRSEKGRSMVEMLGVLAIIGVLSVGGIYGYTVAMKKYKTNEVAAAVNMLGVLARATNAGAGLQTSGGTTSLTGVEAGIYTSDVQGCALTATKQEGDTVTIKIADASGKKCSVISDVKALSFTEITVTS
jgi:Tfp pilus assembly protein PilE